MPVRPHSFEGFNFSLLQLVGKGPKFTITCGECRVTFKQRIPMTDNPGVPCPHCGVVNVLPLEVE
jgi:hypothetical protein